MLFYAGGMTLEPVREVLSGKCNDVRICRDNTSVSEAYYTLITVKDRDCAKKLLSVFENSERALPEDTKPYIQCFTQNELLCYVFDYKPERRLAMFAPGQIDSVYIWESVCINLVMECMASPLPYPLLALALEQGQVHLSKDHSVFLSYGFDLAQLNPDSGERVCACKCADLMLSLFSFAGSRVKSAELMRKKLSKNAYQGLSELYRDIKVTAVPLKKISLTSRLRGFWSHVKDICFRMLLIFCIAVVVLALIVLISQILFGGVPFFRLFESCFDWIGTRFLA